MRKKSHKQNYNRILHTFTGAKAECVHYEGDIHEDTCEAKYT